VAIHPKYLLLAPPALWASIGLIALLWPSHLSPLFPLLWALNDAALVSALFGILLWAFRGPGPVGPPEPREWTIAPAPELAAMPVEGVLRVLAARARRER
jgi:hypothetical protein